MFSSSQKNSSNNKTFHSKNINTKGLEMKTQLNVAEAIKK